MLRSTLLPLIPVHVACILLDVIVGVVLWVIGLPIVAVLAKRRAWEVTRSRFYTYRDGSRRVVLAWAPRWAWLWGNEEDGVAGGGEWVRTRTHWGPWRRAFVWSALRNPVNNLRFVSPFGMRIRPARIRVRGNSVESPIADERGTGVVRLRWSYVWQGVRAGLWVRVPLAKWLHFTRRAGFPWISVRVQREPYVVNLRAGWKLIPSDAYGVDPYDYRAPMVGTGLQIQWRPPGV